MEAYIYLKRIKRLHLRDTSDAKGIGKVSLDAQGHNPQVAGASKPRLKRGGLKWVGCGCSVHSVATISGSARYRDPCWPKQEDGKPGLS